MDIPNRHPAAIHSHGKLGPIGRKCKFRFPVLETLIFRLLVKRKGHAGKGRNIFYCLCRQSLNSECQSVHCFPLNMCLGECACLGIVWLVAPQA